MDVRALERRRGYRKKCPVCGISFNPMLNQIYCSSVCRQKAFRLVHKQKKQIVFMDDKKRATLDEGSAERLGLTTDQFKRLTANEQQK